MEVNKKNTQSEEEIYKKAKKRVKELKDFYAHLASFLWVNLFLLILNLWTSPGHLWFFYPMFGWGIGLFFHAIGVFNIIPFFGKEWEDKKIAEILDKKNSQKWV